MDELKQAWAQWESESPISENLPSAGNPQDVLQQILRNVKRKLWYAVFFTLAFAIGIPFTSPLLSQALLCILLAAYLTGSILLFQEWKILRQRVDMTQDVLHNLTTYRDRVLRVIRYEELIALTLYPVSISAGFFVGLKLYNHEAELMDRTTEWIILILLILIFTLAGHRVSHRLNQRAFGHQLQRLNENIQQLQKNE